jgi:type I restriction enzyme R subunit
VTSKKLLTEQQIREQYLDPELSRAGWTLHDNLAVEVRLTPGPVLVQGQSSIRGEERRADYVLYAQPNLPIAVVEAKDNKHSVRGGMQQALVYAEMLDAPFVFSSNGDAFFEHDRTGTRTPVEREIPLTAFPSPAALWQRYAVWKGIAGPAPAVEQPYHEDQGGRSPRYYQVRAINRAVAAIAAGRPRALLVMATGTGKTYVAFQIVWRLWKAKIKRRILFLADRNVLVDQAMDNDFKHFGGAMTKIEDRRIDKSFEVYLALYQAVTGGDDTRNIFRKFSPDFFDLIVVDECHRGSATANSAWRDVLDYFASATKLGLTATPKETEDVSTTDYFGPPVDTYSLGQGIADGFLAPYKVVRIDLDKDLDGWAARAGQRDKHGRAIAPRTYQRRDFDRTLVLEQRTEIVAHEISEHLEATGRMQKTIVFCEDIEHAERMTTALVNENPDLCATNRKYVMQITGDQLDGKREIYNFTHPAEEYPVIATTSKLLTTGVDTQTVKVIAIDQNIGSMSEFKQIIGRGTRIREDFGKTWFTILDFRGATAHFSDPGFDGLPVQVYTPRPGEPTVPPDLGAPAAGDPVPLAKQEQGSRVKLYVDDVDVTVREQLVFRYGPDGELIAGSAREVAQRLVGASYVSYERLRDSYLAVETKALLLNVLAQGGLDLPDLRREIGDAFSPLDLLAAAAFDRAPRTRAERAALPGVAAHLQAQPAPVREVLAVLVDKFTRERVDDLLDTGLLRVPPLSDLGTPLELLGRFGGREGFRQAARALEAALYETVVPPA